MFKQLLKKIIKPCRRYWYVTDFWEKYHVIPVIYDGNRLVWHLGDGFYEYYYKHEYNRSQLFRRQKRAERAAAKLNERA